MKHLLPILSLALVGAAVTAFADDEEATSTVATSPSKYYHDYYLDPPNTKPVDNAPGSSYWEGHNQSDTFTYGTRDNQGNVIENPNVFTVARESNWGNNIILDGNKNNFYRVEFANYVGTESGSVENEDYSYTVTKTPNQGKVTLYLTDYVSEAVAQAQYPTAYNSSTNALFNMGIVEYGYRVLSTTDGMTYTAGQTVSYEILKEDSEGEIVVGDKRYSLSDRVTPIDSIDYNGTGKEEDYMTRYKYELGTFSGTDIIEVYMKDSAGREIYSFSSYEFNETTGEYEYTPFDKTTIGGNGAAMGGFGDGGYRVAPIETDKMLYSYYFSEMLDNNTRDNPEYKETSYEKFDASYTPIGNMSHEEIASSKAMPLSFLKPGNDINVLGFGKQVAFGFYGVAVGSPLPSGLQLALIAGLFGLGFCYVRRRKAIVG